MKGFVLYGERKSGKTTMIINFAEKWNAAGIASPEVNGLKVIRNLKSGELFPFQRDCGKAQEDNTLKVGRYCFDKRTFEIARNIVLSAVRDGESIVIIDEYGYLELEGKGFEPLLDRVVRMGEDKNLILIIVVRKALLNKFLKRFSFVNWRCVESDKEIEI